MKYSILSLSFVSITIAADLSPQEVLDQQNGLNNWQEMIAKSSNLPPEEAIEILGQGVRKTSIPSIYSIKGTNQVHLQLQKKLISIPGHAEYYKKKIQDETPRIRANGDNNVREVRWIFETLQQLPSRETVAVLGELLHDETGMKGYVEGWKNFYSKDSPEHTPPEPGVCMHAAATLAKLPLKSKPHTRLWGGELKDMEDMQRWRNWYQQIKEGRRTFSFEGDPTEYDLNGPVREARNPDLPRAERRPSVPEKAEGPTPPSFRMPFLATLVGIFATITGVFFFKRKSA